MSIVTFPWTHNGPQALSILQEVLYARFVHLVGVSEYGHNTAQVQETPLDSGARNEAFFIFGRKRSANDDVAMVTS